MSSNKPTVINSEGVLAEFPSAREILTTTESYTILTATATVDSPAKIAADSSSGPFTINLDTDPSPDDVVRIKDYKRCFCTNNVTVNPGSKKVEGELGAFVLDVDGIEADMEFINDIRGWLVRFKL